MDFIRNPRQLRLYSCDVVVTWDGPNCYNFSPMGRAIPSDDFFILCYDTIWRMYYKKTLLQINTRMQW